MIFLCVFIGLLSSYMAYYFFTGKIITLLEEKNQITKNEKEVWQFLKIAKHLSILLLVFSFMFFAAALLPNFRNNYLVYGFFIWTILLVFTLWYIETSSKYKKS